MSVYKASRVAGINNATAKDIIRKYRKSGTVFVRKEELKLFERRGRHPVDKDAPVVRTKVEEESSVIQELENEPQIRNTEANEPDDENAAYCPLLPMMFYCML